MARNGPNRNYESANRKLNMLVQRATIHHELERVKVQENLIYTNEKLSGTDTDK